MTEKAVRITVIIITLVLFLSLVFACCATVVEAAAPEAGFFVTLFPDDRMWYYVEASPWKTETYEIHFITRGAGVCWVNIRKVIGNKWSYFCRLCTVSFWTETIETPEMTCQGEPDRLILSSYTKTLPYLNRLPLARKE